MGEIKDKIKVMWRWYHGARGDNKILFDMWLIVDHVVSNAAKQKAMMK